MEIKIKAMTPGYVAVSADTPRGDFDGEGETLSEALRDLADNLEAAEL